MGYQSAYTRALLGHDRRAEGIKELNEYWDAQRKRAKEEGRKRFVSTVLGIAGSAFGPIGSFIGSTIGTLGTDLLGDAEKSKVSRGKFDGYESDIVNKSLDDYDIAGNIGNVTSIAKSGLMNFMAAGGYSGLKESGGDFMDFATTWGSGADAKMSLSKWIGMDSVEKLDSGIGNIGYLEYLLGVQGTGHAPGVLPDDASILGPNSKDPTTFLKGFGNKKPGLGMIPSDFEEIFKQFREMNK